MKLLSLFMCLCVSLSSNYVSFDRYDAADRCFVDFIQTEIDNVDDLVYTRTPLYNFDLEETGWKYDFSDGSQYGYALIAEFSYGTNRCYEIEEVYFNENSAFDSIDGLPIYVTLRTYIEFKDGAFYDIASGLQLTDEVIDAVKDRSFAYKSNDYSYDYVTETVNYTSKTVVEDHSIQYGIPLYCSSSSNLSCANIAGAVIIGYYDRMNEDLIPNFVAYRKLGSSIRYKSSSTEVEAVTHELYNLMGTSSDGGTTYSGFINGLAQYGINKGVTFVFSSVMSNNAFNYNQYKSEVDLAKPVALFMSGFSLMADTAIVEGNGTDTIKTYQYATATHVVVGYGYKRIQYYNGSTLIKDMRMLKCSSNFPLTNPAYINIDGIGNIDKAVSVGMN